MTKNKKIVIAIAVVLIIAIVVYLAWDSPLMEKLRGVKKMDDSVDTAKKDTTVINPATPNLIPTPIVANDDFPLKIGSRGSNVKYLQTALNKINEKGGLPNKYEPLVVDGIFGDATRIAIVTLVGTRYWNSAGLSQSNWTSILNKANAL